jgi:hypothetical protein
MMGSEFVESLQRQLRESQEQARQQQARADHFEKLATDHLVAGVSPQASPTTFSFPSSSNAVSQSSATMLSRSKSNMGSRVSMSSLSTGQPSTEQHQPIRRERRAFSQQSPAMNRSASTQSNSAMPFGRTGASIAPISGAPPRRTSAPQSDLTFSRPLTDVQEYGQGPDVGVTPDVYLANQDPVSYVETTRNLAVNDIMLFQKVSAPPSMCSASSAPEAPSPLTRQNSTTMWNSSTDMVKNLSSQTMWMDSLSEEGLHPSTSTDGLSQQTSKQQPDYDLLGCGASLQDTNVQGNVLLSFDNLPDWSIPMSRNDSSSTNRSTASHQEARAVARRQEVLRNIKTTTIAPKSQTSAAVQSPNESPRKSKVQQARKSPYQRPSHPRVSCTLCDVKPEGFRGVHELSRHMSAKHSATTVKYVCRDPASVGISSKYTPPVPLSDCKSCQKGKQYNAYYNAGAHLRRWHFLPKTNGKGKRAPVEKRGGMAGGSWPPMSELKNWFQKVTISNQAESFTADDEDDEAEVDAEGLEEYRDAIPVEMMDVSPMNSSLASFDVCADGFGLGGLGENADAVTSSTHVSESSSMLDPALLPAPSDMDNMPTGFFTADAPPPMWDSSTCTPPTFDFMNHDSLPDAFPAFN